MTEFADKILLVTSNDKTENAILQDELNNTMQGTWNNKIEDTNKSKAENLKKFNTFKDSALQQKIKDTSTTWSELIEIKPAALCRPFKGM